MIPIVGRGFIFCGVYISLEQCLPSNVQGKAADLEAWRTNLSQKCRETYCCLEMLLNRE